MNSFNNLEKAVKAHQALQLSPKSLEESTTLNITQAIEALALFVAQAWQDTYPNLQSNFDAEFNHCVSCVTAEIAKAGAAVGGPTGLEILTGGGSQAARRVCKQILSEARTVSQNSKLDWSPSQASVRKLR